MSAPTLHRPAGRERAGTWEAMDAGNELQRAWDHEDALALLTIGAIETHRANKAIELGVGFDATVGPPTIRAASVGAAFPEDGR